MPDLGAEKCKHSFILQYIKYDPPNSIDLSGEWSQCPPHAEGIFQKYISG